MHITPIIRRVAAVAGIAATLLAVAAPTASAANQHDIPPTLRVENTHKEFLVASAEGVQIYGCTATATGPAWTLTAPRATLRDRRGRVVATHFGGPTWQANDGSTVVGQRVDGVTVDPTAVAWLLLSAASTTGGPGSLLGQTTFIQRTDTVGGLAPAASDCNAGTLGATVEIPYTADYHFWKAKPGCRR